MNLLEKYHNAAQDGFITADPEQIKILEILQTVTEQILRKPFYLFPWSKKKAKGIYLFGPVGCGKTFLMDLFYENLPLQNKKRFHFHHFMQQIDKRLRTLQGNKNPLRIIAKEIKANTHVLCLDEFMVNDLSYAIILSELLQLLFAKGVLIFATSNTSPNTLYEQGIHRERFIPAIKAIETHCVIYSVVQAQDYRLTPGVKIESYLYPLREDKRAQFQQQVQHFMQVSTEPGEIQIQNRMIPYLYKAEGMIGFHFQTLCNTPRCQLDYLEIAEKFHTIFISDVPQLGEKQTLQAILFMHFVDVIYDRGIRLFILAEVSLEHLYVQGEKAQDFQRTISRLREMQTQTYLIRHPWRQLNSNEQLPDN